MLKRLNEKNARRAAELATAKGMAIPVESRIEQVSPSSADLKVVDTTVAEGHVDASTAGAELSSLQKRPRGPPVRSFGPTTQSGRYYPANASPLRPLWKPRRLGDTCANL